MADQCGICEEELTTRPRIELLCGHTYHTQCFLTNAAVAEDIHDIHCVVCQTGVLPAEEEEQEEEQEEQEDDAETVASNESQQEQQRVLTLWDTNPRFRELIKKYMKAYRGSYQPCQAFKRLVNAKKAELNPVYEPLKLQLEGLYAVKKEEITTSPEYKAYKSAEMKYTRYFTMIQRDYNISGWSLYYLRAKKGCKRIQRPYRWRSSPRYIIRRGLRFRLKYY
jgi:hypothetical protein